MADDSRTLRLVAAALALVAGLFALVTACWRWSHRGAPDWLELVLGVGFLGLGVYWWRRARVA